MSKIHKQKKNYYESWGNFLISQRMFTLVQDICIIHCSFTSLSWRQSCIWFRFRSKTTGFTKQSETRLLKSSPVCSTDELSKFCTRMVVWRWRNVYDCLCLCRSLVAGKRKVDGRGVEKGGKKARARLPLGWFCFGDKIKYTLRLVPYLLK